jgi:hypothetical protein
MSINGRTILKIKEISSGDTDSVALTSATSSVTGLYENGAEPSGSVNEDTSLIS